MSTFLKEASDYLQNLSALHVDILHSANNFAFCRFKDKQQFNQLTLNASKNIVVVGSFHGSAIGTLMMISSEERFAGALFQLCKNSQFSDIIAC
jgi:hypothetical protein